MMPEGQKKKMQIRLRKFEKRDIEDKIKWINDSNNNTYLHYDLPLELEKTEAWFEKNKDRADRYDAIIEVDGNSVGLIGLLGIDFKNKKAEYYICIGEADYKGKGVATIASKMLLEYAFDTIGLNKVYLYTEYDNISAQRLFERLGFKKEGLLKEDIIYNDRRVDRFFYGITKQGYKNVGNNN